MLTAPRKYTIPISALHVYNYGTNIPTKDGPNTHYYNLYVSSRFKDVLVALQLKTNTKHLHTKPNYKSKKKWIPKDR